MSIHVAIGLAVLASVGFNVGTAFQKSAAVRLPRISFPPSLRTLHAFVTDRAWMTALFLMLISEGCFLIAAANAPISLVQPLLGMGLVVLAGFSVFYLNEKLSAGEWIGVGTLIVGLALLGGSAEQEEVRGLEAISWGRLVGLTLLLLLFVLAARVVELRRPGRFSIELVLGAASGVMMGIGALFTRVTMLEFKAGNVVFGVLLVTVTLGSFLIGTITQQGGFQRGRAITVSAILAVLNKVIAIFGGMFALGEVLPENAVKQGLRVTALAALLGGTILMARFNRQQIASAAAESGIEASAARVDSS